MAEILASVLIPLVLEKLKSVALSGQLLGYEVFDKWAEIRDMTTFGAGDERPDQQLWVQDLGHLAYDMEDILNDLEAEFKQRNLKIESFANSTAGKVIPASLVNFTPRKIMYDRKMVSKLDEITSKLDDLYEKGSLFNSNFNGPMLISRENERLMSTSEMVDESMIVGREVDKEVLLHKLLNDDENVSFLAIVGMGGIGKTTMAQLLYKDKRVEDNFEIMAWYCVGDELDVFDASLKIFESVVQHRQEFVSLNMLQVALKQKLSNKKFLLVLDGVWNLNYQWMEWEHFLRLFGAGAPGSRIIVTTRKMTVASIMEPVQVYHMEALSHEDALSLISQVALGRKGFDSYPTLKVYGEEIVKKCGGLPLALIELGRNLRTKTHEDECKELLDSEMWDIKSETLACLKLTYNYLSAQLKRVFAYCSLFPRGYVFDKDELVQLWMAEGFLFQPRDHKSMESLGGEFFEYLKSHYIYQHLTGSRCTMHALMYDLAKSISRDFFFMLDVNNKDDNDWKDALEKSHHFSFVSRQFGAYHKFKPLENATRLRTFLGMPVTVDGCQKQLHLSEKVLVELLPKLQFLRVLSLTNYSITKIPKSIGSLKNIRYLNGLKHLQGRLSIEGLHKVKSATKANLQQMKHLDDLAMEWSHVFDDKFRNKEVEYEVLHMLEPRHELRKLEILFYGGETFPSWVENPSFSKLTQVTLRGCENCTRLPTLGHLESLRKLFVERMNKVTFWNSDAFSALEFLGFKNMEKWEKWSMESGDNNSCFPRLREISLVNCPNLAIETTKSIPSLEVLHIEGCSESVLRSMVGMSSSIVRLRMDSIKGLTQLHGEEEVFQHLEKLEYLCITKCHELKYLWEFDSEACKILLRLRHLEVGSCKKLESLGKKEEVNLGISFKSVREVSLINCDKLKSYNCPESIERLVIHKCHSVTSLNFPTAHSLPPTLKFLDIRHCGNLKNGWLVDNLLTSLYICDMPNVKSFPKAIFAHLTKLIINGCDNIESIPMEAFGSAHCIRHLEVINCENLKSFPHELLPSFTSLKELLISNCPQLTSFPCEFWPPNLSSLRIGRLNKPISDWGRQPFPVSLVNLCLIGENSALHSFQEFLLPSSLTRLEIIGFLYLESFAKHLDHLTSLEQLAIESCPKLTDLPESRIPSLSSLKVSSSLKLQKRCRSKKGNYRQIISEIAQVDV